jgi:hypothetical protein
MSYDLDLIKTMLPEYLERVGVVITKRTASHIECLCPLHQDSDPSFKANLVDGVWLWKCWPCDTGGTVIDLHADKNGISRRGHDAIKGTAEVLGISDNGESPPPMTAGQRRSIAAANAKRDAERIEKEVTAEITEALKGKRMQILAPYLSDSWRADFWDESPVILDTPESDDSNLFIRALFDPEDVLWLGDQFDSGQPKHEANFRSAADWLKLKSLPPRIASGIFKPGIISRSDANLTSSPFIVIESDDLIGHKPTDDLEREDNKRLCAALITLCRDRLKLTLCAVIDTGGKSLHGWFDRPSEDALETLMSISQGLAIDTAVITRASNPLRLPGCLHQSTGRPARLLYLNSKTF